MDILGVASAGASVTVNGSAADHQRNEYFWENLGVTLGTDPLWQNVSVSAGGTASTGNLLLPPATQSFTYDDDGNMTFDGVWNYYYVYNWATSAYSGTAASDTKFYWDEWNLIHETTSGTGAGWKSYMWGLDLSGTEQGAGGVGGLLLFRDSAQGAHFPAYDGNGNVTKLISTTDSTTTAEYEYAPFGQLIRASGPAAELNPIRFSSKYQDQHTDCIYYGYRFYIPASGRWLNRCQQAFRIDPVSGVEI